jgi:hypothetical protein
MLPSQRMRAPDRSRLRPRSVKVYRCCDCKVVYDARPVRLMAGVRFLNRCPNLACGDSSIREGRAKD